MSTYNKITRHPQTGKWELAQWIDDYFGDHVYGVKFDSNGKVYPAEIVDNKNPLTFWADDVTEAFKIYVKNTQNVIDSDYEYLDKELIKFLDGLEKEHKKFKLRGNR